MEDAVNQLAVVNQFTIVLVKAVVAVAVTVCVTAVCVVGCVTVVCVDAVTRNTVRAESPTGAAVTVT